MTNVNKQPQTKQKNAQANNVIPMRDAGDKAEDIAKMYARSLSPESTRYPLHEFVVIIAACLLGVACWIGIYRGISYLMGYGF